MSRLKENVSDVLTVCSVCDRHFFPWYHNKLSSNISQCEK